MIRESCLFPLGEAWDFMKLGCKKKTVSPVFPLFGKVHTKRGWLLVGISLELMAVTHFPGQILTGMLWFFWVEVLEGVLFQSGSLIGLIGVQLLVYVPSGYD